MKLLKCLFIVTLFQIAWIHAQERPDKAKILSEISSVFEKLSEKVPSKDGTSVFEKQAKYFNRIKNDPSLVSMDPSRMEDPVCHQIVQFYLGDRKRFDGKTIDDLGGPLGFSLFNQIERDHPILLRKGVTMRLAYFELLKNTKDGKYGSALWETFVQSLNDMNSKEQAKEINATDFDAVMLLYLVYSKEKMGKSEGINLAAAMNAFFLLVVRENPVACEPFILKLGNQTNEILKRILKLVKYGKITPSEETQIREQLHHASFVLDNEEQAKQAVIRLSRLKLGEYEKFEVENLTSLNLNSVLECVLLENELQSYFYSVSKSPKVKELINQRRILINEINEALFSKR